MCSFSAEIRNAHKIAMVTGIGGLGKTWRDNMKLHLGEIVCEVVNWLQVGPIISSCQ
jgi:hypothetical protein